MSNNNDRFIGSNSRSSSRIEELASDYSSSEEELYEKPSSNYSKYNISNDNIFRFDSNNDNNNSNSNNSCDISRNNENGKLL